MTTRWQLAAAEVAQECENLFQNGGPKVYVRDADASVWALRASSASGERTVFQAFKGQTVYARRKNRETGRYGWFYKEVRE